jgi:hypothetical protein
VPVPSIPRGTSSFTLFDAGSPSQLISVPTAGSNGLPSTLTPGVVVTDTMAAGFRYAYIVGSATMTTITTIALNTSQRVVVGIDYLSSHSLLIDFINQTEGFR